MSRPDDTNTPLWIESTRHVFSGAISVRPPPVEGRIRANPTIKRITIAVPCGKRFVCRITRILRVGPLGIKSESELTTDDECDVVKFAGVKDKYPAIIEISIAKGAFVH